MIEVHDLHKSFKTKTGLVKAVQGVSFGARDGEITGLLGPNGAGKTTTLRMLYTLMSPQSGRVEVDGFDSVRDADTVRRPWACCGCTGSKATDRAREHVIRRCTACPHQTLDAAPPSFAARGRRCSNGRRKLFRRARTKMRRAGAGADPKNVILDEPPTDSMYDHARTREFLRQLRDEVAAGFFQPHHAGGVRHCAKHVLLAKAR